MDYSYWGLKESPFRWGLDPKGFFLSGVHEEALARLEFLVQHGRRLGLLVGQAGTGKSLLLEVFSANLRRTGRPIASLSAAGATGQEWLWDMLIALGRTPKPETPIPLLWRQLFDRFREASLVGQTAVILCDQMESATEESWQTLARLLGYAFRPEWAVTVILSGRPEVLRQVGAAVLDRVDLQMALEPWELSDTQRYLVESLSRTGRNQPIFTPAATERLHELSGGVPRRIAHLADWSLLAGAVQGAACIDAEIVESVYHELKRTHPAVGDMDSLSPAL